jgi:hypothetical protein
MFIIPTLLSAIGGFGQAISQKSNADRNALLNIENAAVRRDAERIALQFDEARARTAFNGAKVNFLLVHAEARARNKNAERLRQYAKARTKQGREAVRRQSREFNRFSSSQKAAAAGSGVAISGSVLDVMGDTMGMMQDQLQDMHDEINFGRTETLNQAATEEFQASQSMASGKFQLATARSAMLLSVEATKIGYMSADAQHGSSLLAAQLGQISGRQRALGTAINTGVGIFQGISGK